jgi:hypothetical protein
MVVHVHIAPLLRKPMGQELVALEMEQPCSVSEAIAALGYNELEQRALRMSRQNDMLTPGSRLLDGDVVLLFAAVGGG